MGCSLGDIGRRNLLGGGSPGHRRIDRAFGSDGWKRRQDVLHEIVRAQVDYVLARVNQLLLCVIESLDWTCTVRQLCADARQVHDAQLRMSAQHPRRRIGELVISRAHIGSGVVHAYCPEENLGSVNGFVDCSSIELVAGDDTRSARSQVLYLACSACQYRDLRLAAVEQNVGQLASNMS